MVIALTLVTWHKFNGGNYFKFGNLACVTQNVGNYNKINQPNYLWLFLLVAPITIGDMLFQPVISSSAHSPLKKFPQDRLKSDMLLDVLLETWVIWYRPFSWCCHVREWETARHCQKLHSVSATISLRAWFYKHCSNTRYSMQQC